MKKERFIFADVIRTIAIIFVIMIHTTAVICMMWY